MTETHQYPISEHESESVKSKSNKPLDDIQIHNLAKGELEPEDLRIRAESLNIQAVIARQAGYDRLAENLERSAELTNIPDEDLLRFYNALRPGRSTYPELVELARILEEDFNAPLCASFFRECSEAYKSRKLLRKIEV